MKMTMNQALALLATANFEPFTDADWYAFSGCESKEPKLYYDEIAGLTIIHDGEVIDFIDDDGESIAQLKLTTN
jgi:hypothetical protein